MSRSLTEAPAADDRRAGGGRWWRRRREHLVYAAAGGFWAVGDGSSPQPTIGELCAAATTGRWRVLVAASMLHHLVVRDPDLPLTSAAQLQRYARLQFTTVHGPQAEHWPLALWSEWPLQVAVALHGLDLAALRRELHDRGTRLSGVAPCWTRAWSAARRADREWSAFGERALLWVEGGLTGPVDAEAGARSQAPAAPWATWIAADRQGLRSFRQRRLADRSTLAALGLADELAAEDGIDGRQVLISGYGLTGEPGAALARAAGDLCRPLPEARWLQG